MTVRSMSLHRAASVATSTETEAAIRSRAVLEQMYSYFNWDDLPFTAAADEAGDYPLVA